MGPQQHLHHQWDTRICGSIRWDLSAEWANFAQCWCACVLLACVRAAFPCAMGPGRLPDASYACAMCSTSRRSTFSTPPSTCTSSPTPTTPSTWDYRPLLLGPVRRAASAVSVPVVLLWAERRQLTRSQHPTLGVGTVHLRRPRLRMSCALRRWCLGVGGG